MTILKQRMIVWIKQILKNLLVKGQSLLYFLITLFLSFILVFWPLYRYLFRNTVIYKLPLDLWATSSYVLIGIYVLNLMTWVILLCFAVYRNLIMREIIKGNSNSIFYRLSKTLNKFYNGRIITLYQFFVNTFHLECWLFRPILEPLTRTAIRYLYNAIRLRYAVIFVSIGPSIVFMSIFFYDIVILNEVYYTVKFISILLLPLVDRFLRFWFHQYSNVYRKHCSDALIFIYNNQYYFAEALINAQIDFDINECDYNKRHRITFNILLPLPYYKTMVGLIRPTYFEKKIYIYDLNEHSSFKEIAAVFSEKCIPISVFGVFYTSTYKYIHFLFSIPRAVFYVCIWSYVIAISL